MIERHPDAAFADLWQHWTAYRATEADIFRRLDHPEENAAYQRVRDQRQATGDEIMARTPQTIVGVLAQLRIASTIILDNYEGVDDDLNQRWFRTILKNAERAAGDVLPPWHPDDDCRLFG